MRIGVAPRGPWAVFLLGVASGVLLAGAYVRFGILLPARLAPFAALSRTALLSVSEDPLFSPEATLWSRQRAVALRIAARPECYSRTDEALGYAFTREVLRREALARVASLQRDMADLYGEGDAATGVREKVLDAIREDSFLLYYLRKRFPAVTDSRLVDLVMETDPRADFEGPPMEMGRLRVLFTVPIAHPAAC